MTSLKLTFSDVGGHICLIRHVPDITPADPATGQQIRTNPVGTAIGALLHMSEHARDGSFAVSVDALPCRTRDIDTIVIEDDFHGETTVAQIRDLLAAAVTAERDEIDMGPFGTLTATDRERLVTVYPQLAATR